MLLAKLVDRNVNLDNVAVGYQPANQHLERLRNVDVIRPRVTRLVTVDRRRDRNIRCYGTNKSVEFATKSAICQHFT